MTASDISGAELSNGTLHSDSPGTDTAPESEDSEGGMMSLIDHLEELRGRIIKCLIAVVVGSLAGFVFWERVLGTRSGNAFWIFWRDRSQMCSRSCTPRMARSSSSLG